MIKNDPENQCVKILEGHSSPVDDTHHSLNLVYHYTIVTVGILHRLFQSFEGFVRNV